MLSIIQFYYSFTINVFFHFVDIFVLEVDATGSGTSSNPFQTYSKRGHEAVLQCIFERIHLKWYKNQRILASENSVINSTKYKVSNTSTGLYFRLHVLNTQPDDEGIYICRGGLNEDYYIQLILYGTQWYTN